MASTLFHHVNIDIVNHILQFNGKETYVDVRNKRHIRFTKAYISNHSLNLLQRVIAYKCIKKFIQKLKKQLKKVDLEEICIKKSYHRYLVGFIDRIKYIDERYQNCRRIQYTRNIKIPMMIIYPRQRRYIYISDIYTDKNKKIECKIYHFHTHFYLTLDSKELHIKEMLWF